MASIVSHISRIIPAQSPSQWRAHAAELALYIGFYVLYLLSRGLVFEGDGPALTNAELVMALERRMGLFVEPSIQEWAISNAQSLVVLLNWVYIITYWPVILGVAFFLYLARRATYVKYRRLIAVHLVLALILFALFPLAPPFKTAYLVDTIQLFGPSFYGSEDMGRFYNTNAAMPSLHFSWTCIFAWLFVKELRGWYRYLGVGYPLLTLAAIVVTGNHFLLDAVVGVALIGVAVGALAAFYKLWGRLGRVQS